MPFKIIRSQLSCFDQNSGKVASSPIIGNIVTKCQRPPLFVSFAEIFYITLQEKGEEEAKKRIKIMNRLVITRVESSQELGLIAGRLKATHKISFADTWIAATAIFYGAILVHKDPEFEQLKDKVKVLELPYKKSI